METIIITTKTDLKEILQELLLPVQSNQQKNPSEESPDKYLTSDEVIEIAKASRTTLYWWNKKGWLKPSKIGRKLLYKESELHSFIANRKNI